MKSILHTSVWSILVKKYQESPPAGGAPNGLVPVVLRQSFFERYNPSPRKQKLKVGMTLVELILAMGILSILLVIIMAVFVQIIEMKLSAEAESAVTQDARYIYARLLYDINRADSVDAPLNPGEAADSLVLSIGTETHTYAVDAEGKLTVDKGSGPVELSSAGSKIVPHPSPGAYFTQVGDVGGGQSVKIELPMESVIQRVQGQASLMIETTGGTR